MARGLDWGWVVADEYRSTSERRWINVNRPTEKPWIGGRFRSAETTAAARRAYADYQQKVSRTGRRSYSTGVDLPLLEMNCLLDQEDRIKQQVLAGNGYLAQQLDSWAILLQYDKTSILAKAAKLDAVAAS